MNGPIALFDINCLVLLHYMCEWGMLFCYSKSNLCLGKAEKEYEMILKKTVQSICVLSVHPNTTTSIIIQVRQSKSKDELHSIDIC